jgi:uncharacterized membrane protein YgaE (UPF0421/DUF939 family)
MLRSFLKHVQAPRRLTRASAVAAAFYAAQAVVCTFVVIAIYNRFELGSAMWAVVSAVLVLQPGLEQSYGASVTRFISNLIGAITGALVDKLHGHGPADVMLALVLVVGFCELLRLDQGLRSACASAAIVMMSVGGAVVAHATERRVLAVVIGCTTALAVRLLFERIEQRLRPGIAGPRPAAPAQVDEG